MKIGLTRLKEPRLKERKRAYALVTFLIGILWCLDDVKHRRNWLGDCFGDEYIKRQPHNRALSGDILPATHRHTTYGMHDCVFPFSNVRVFLID